MAARARRCRERPSSAHGHTGGQAAGHATYFWQANARGWCRNAAPWPNANLRQLASQTWPGVTNRARQALRVDFDVSDSGNEGSW